jgi:hypothetical protein
MIWSIVFLQLIFLQYVSAHSWLDCLSPTYNVAGSIGLQNDWQYSAARTHGSCDGYPRNYAPRDLYNTNEINTKQILYTNMKNPNYPICAGQSRSSYVDWRHMLTSKPGQTIYMGYTENGHLSKTFDGVGTNITIYYRSDGGEVKTVSDMLNSNIAGQVDFDDGKMCGEPSDSKGRRNGRTGRPCVQSFVVPKLCPGIYSFVWWWPEKGLSGFYSCFDIKVV